MQIKLTIWQKNLDGTEIENDGMSARMALNDAAMLLNDVNL